MNKGITVLILFVVLGAMGLVFFAHTRQPAESPGQREPDTQPRPVEPVAGDPDSGGQAGGGVSSPLRAPQDGNAGLKQIDPPLTSGRTGADGVPAPVRLTSRSEGVPPPGIVPPASTAPTGGNSAQRPVAPGTGLPPSSATGQDPAPGRADTGRPPSGSPELTPWGTPSSRVQPEKAEQPDTRTAQAGSAAQNAGSGPADRTKPQGRDAGKTPVAPTVKEPVLSDKASHVLKEAGLHFSGQGMQLRLEADTPFPCRTFVLNNPHRLVIDLPGSWKGMKTPSLPQNRLINKVRVGSQPAGPRIVLDLESAPKGHKVQRNGNIVEILVE